MKIVFFLYTYIPKIRDLSLTLSEVKRVLSNMTYCLSVAFLKLKKMIPWHSNIDLAYTGIYGIKFQYRSRVVTS